MNKIEPNEDFLGNLLEYPSFSKSGKMLRVSILESPKDMMVPLESIAKDMRDLFTDVNGVNLFHRCGFSFNNHCEIMVDIPNWYLTCSETDEIRFRVGEMSINVGNCSELWDLLLGKLYYNEDVGQEMFLEGGWCTLKIFNKPKNISFEDAIVNALFQLNSYYLGGSSATISELFRHHDPLPEDWAGEGKFKINQSRRATRALFSSLDPLMLFNAASASKGESQFLGFYRVIEYFFSKHRNSVIDSARYDARVETKELIKIVSGKKEIDILTDLLSSNLSPSYKKKLSGHSFRRGLIKKDLFGLFVEALYAYRCSIVHAKESEIDKADIPNPFINNSLQAYWSSTVQNIAKQIIARLCQTRDLS